MARLIVNDGTTSRRFQLKPGKISIGSGQSSKLRLEDSQLAELHAELEYDGEEATLRLGRGVRPAEAGGRNISGEWTMVDGQAVDLGGVTLMIEYEGARAASLVERRDKLGKASSSTSRGDGVRANKAGKRLERRPKVGTRARQKGARTVSEGSGRTEIQHQRRTVKRGLPTWAMLGIAAVLLFIGYRMTQSYATSVDEHGFVPQASYNRIQDGFKGSNFALIEGELDKVFAHQDLDREWKAKFEQCREQLEAALKVGETAIDNQRGTTYLDSKLKKFESMRLTRSKELPKVRVFLQRLKYFQERWPSHPELDWVKRTERRYQEIDDLSEPPDFEDIAFEAETLTWAAPRDYKQCMKLLNDYLDEAAPQERDGVLELIAQKEADQKEYFDDRLLQAKFEWEKGDPQAQAKGVEHLVQLSTKLSDPDMVAEATRRLLLIPDIDSRWGGYAQDRPDTYDDLKANETILAHLKEIGRE